MVFNCVKKEALTSTGDEYTRNDLLICSTNGYIYAIYKKDGTIIWSTYIAITASVISLFVSDNDRVIAGAAGYTYSIDLMTGEIKWTNSMSVSNGSVCVTVTIINERFLYRDLGTVKFLLLLLLVLKKKVLKRYQNTSKKR